MSFFQDKCRVDGERKRRQRRYKIKQEGESYGLQDLKGLSNAILVSVGTDAPHIQNRTLPWPRSSLTHPSTKHRTQIEAITSPGPDCTVWRTVPLEPFLCHIFATFRTRPRPSAAPGPGVAPSSNIRDIGANCEGRISISKSHRMTRPTAGSTPRESRSKKTTGHIISS